MDYNNLRKLNEEIYTDVRDNLNGMNTTIKSIDRTVAICEQSDFIISKLDEQFLQKACLKKKDLPFLFLAIALQTTRWFLMPSLDLDFSQISKDERLSANEIKEEGPLQGKRSGQRYEKPEINKIKHKEIEKYNKEVAEYQNKIRGNGTYQYLSWVEILFHAVPYDAMEGSENISIQRKSLLGKKEFISPLGKQLCGKNHHVATLGHDPVLGWIFGTMNIMSGMITFCDLQTFPVNQNIQLDKWEQDIDYAHPSNIVEMLKYCMNSLCEDSKRLPAAVARQAIHMQSDKYTKDGLPIPLLSPALAQHLIEKGWNSNEAERLLKKITKNIGIIGLQFSMAEFINILIRSMYLILNMESEVDISSSKIERILKISSIIAEGSNVAVVVATRKLSSLDIGGLISMVHQIAWDSKTRNQIECEFLNREFENIVMEDS